MSQLNMHATMLAEKGKAELERMMADVSVELVKPYVKLYQQDEKKAFEEIIAVYRNQAGAQLIPIREDNDVIEYQLSPCASGQSPALAPIYQTGQGLDDEGVPLMCRACNKWQDKFNEAVGDDVWTMTPNPSVPGACSMKLKKQSSADVFTKEELWLNATPKPKQALIKLLSNDFDIVDLLDGQLDEWIPWHDYLVRWLEYMFAWVMREYGLDYYDDFMAKTYDTSFGLIYAEIGPLSEEEALAKNAKIWHYHVGKFEVEEEEHRFRFVLDPCGSGGRLYRGEMHLDSFHYGDELAPLIKEKHPIAFNRLDAPGYCTHCASSNRDMFKGNPFVFVVDGEAQSAPGKPCHQYLYKKGAPLDIEQRILAQVNMGEVIPTSTVD
jgi:hypothetical protein